MSDDVSLLLTIRAMGLDGTDAHRRRAMTPEPQSGWQPIETAPKDGSEFLAVFLGRRIICRWSDTWSDWCGVNTVWHDGRGTVTPLRDGLGEGGPTVWMPLPTPPATQGGSDA